MPEPKGGQRLLEYNCKVQYAEQTLAKVRKIKTPDDIRPGTKKGKIDVDDVWMVKIQMPKRLIQNIQRGYNELDKNKVEDILSSVPVNPQQLDQASELQAAEGGADEQPAA
jgi:hypothetical protein